jgi:hypothetical protein
MTGVHAQSTMRRVSSNINRKSNVVCNAFRISGLYVASALINCAFLRHLKIYWLTAGNGNVLEGLRA